MYLGLSSISSLAPEDPRAPTHTFPGLCKQGKGLSGSGRKWLGSYGARPMSTRPDSGLGPALRLGLKRCVDPLSDSSVWSVEVT